MENIKYQTCDDDGHDIYGDHRRDIGKRRKEDKLIYRACPTCGMKLSAWTEEYHKLHRTDVEMQWDATVSRHNELYHKEK